MALAGLCSLTDLEAIPGCHIRLANPFTYLLSGSLLSAGNFGLNTGIDKNLDAMIGEHKLKDNVRSDVSNGVVTLKGTGSLAGSTFVSPEIGGTGAQFEASGE